MKITSIETIRLEEFANLIWLRVHTDEGLVGLGETFFLPETVEAYVHESVAPKLLGRDPLAIDRRRKLRDALLTERRPRVSANQIAQGFKFQHPRAAMEERRRHRLQCYKKAVKSKFSLRPLSRPLRLKALNRKVRKGLRKERKEKI